MTGEAGANQQSIIKSRPRAMIEDDTKDPNPVARELRRRDADEHVGAASAGVQADYLASNERFVSHAICFLAQGNRQLNY